MNIYQMMARLQHGINSEVHQEWFVQGFNWDSAILVESGELLESLGYKWWKEQTPDMNNVRVEAIDLLHFVISKYLDNRTVDMDIQKSIEIFSKEFEEDFTREPLSETSDNLERLIYLLNSDTNQIFIMKRIFDVLEMNTSDIYVAYIVKNCLNYFRQANGYKDGTYIKVWNGLEDNVVAFDLVEKIGATPFLFEELLQMLNKYYSKKLKEKSK